ncbi:hypothetical protein MXD95_007555 [Frankia sp. AiPa1]|nr:hypothetical protein [Frankia sp. AiPa1]
MTASRLFFDTSSFRGGARHRAFQGRDARQPGMTTPPRAAIRRNGWAAAQTRLVAAARVGISGS